MKLKSELQIPASETKLNHSNRVLALGSCFADEIGGRLQQHLFDCCSNPLGTLFNPLAVATLVERALKDQSFNESEFFEHQELWRHNLIHSSLASTLLSESVQIANTALQTLRTYLCESKLLFITLGSAWIYQLKGSDLTIAHNHRRPLDLFSKRLAKPSEIVSRLSMAIDHLHELTPTLKICLTVSPVRHTRDGLHENNVSKSSLHLSVFELTQKYPHIHYFPAFEILNDELRDYRFYAEDLAHPNKLAVDYLWDRFAKTYFDQTTASRISEISTVLNSLQHRPKHETTEAYRTFKNTLHQNILNLEIHGLETNPLLQKWNQLP